MGTGTDGLITSQKKILRLIIVANPFFKLLKVVRLERFLNDKVREFYD
jgi:hypothetical protein